MTESTRVVPLTCHGHSRPVTHISFSQLPPTSVSSSTASPPPNDADDQYYIISACKDNNPMLRDGTTGDWIGTFIGHKGAVWQARLSSCATLAATAAADFSAKVWNTFTGEEMFSLDHNHIVRAVAFPPQERPVILATGGQEKKLRIWDLSRGIGAASDAGGGGGAGAAAGGGTTTKPATPSYEVGAGVHQGTIKSIVWNTDPNILITAADDKKIRWWDLRTHQQPIATHDLAGLPGSCEFESLALDTRSSGVLSVAAGKSVYFFDGDRPAQLIKEVRVPYEVASVALNGPQRKFVTGHPGDTWVRVWDFDAETELEVGKGHHGPVWSVAFSPDGRLYATGSEDGTIKLWKFTQGAFGLWR